MSLDVACFGELPLTYEEETRQRAFVAFIGRYGVPDGEMLWVPPYCAYKAGDKVLVNEKKAVVLRHDQELGIIEVVYAKSRS